MWASGANTFVFLKVVGSAFLASLLAVALSDADMWGD